MIKTFENKSCPLNEIPVYIYKQIISQLSDVISKKINKSVNCGCFPSSFKEAKIKPLHKRNFKYKTITHYTKLHYLKLVM